MCIDIKSKISNGSFCLTFQFFYIINKVKVGFYLDLRNKGGMFSPEMYIDLNIPQRIEFTVNRFSRCWVALYENENILSNEVPSMMTHYFSNRR